MAALYQMMVNYGKLNGTRIFSRRLIEFVTRNHTGDMHDDGMDMPMHAAWACMCAATTETNTRTRRASASPRTFGHGGVGSSYCWADPDSGVSFAYITNSRMPRSVAQPAAGSWWRTSRMRRLIERRAGGGGHR